MAATRWIKVVFPGGPILKAEWCYTQQSPQGGQCFWVMQSVHSLMVHNTQNASWDNISQSTGAADRCGYRAVTIHRPSATLAASRALPARSRKKPISSRFWRSITTLASVASSRAFSIHWPSRAKHGTELTTANAPERDTTYLRGRAAQENKHSNRQLFKCQFKQRAMEAEKVYFCLLDS